MDQSSTANVQTTASKLSSRSLAEYQAELIWMHNRTIRQLKEAKEKEKCEAELRSQQSSQKPQN
ncbi:uncharacterized protein DSM5745_04333 [Aspergillus mulundensis]|uniref:Uncharacterized protein n=1 Tax=Aspergillus mulundensis TaxID=1810919 RepID=A0A3D8SCC9_9EURO|nr:hypothetical protein DSM5745_04333 [Aspergillus mulundensis]RDW84007.1 hypothetical protein DSM5745_04333 [Aspergillus mulundensis]